MKILFLVLMLLHFHCDASIEKIYKKIDNKIEGQQIRNIDFIYLINLDKRVDRLESALNQLAPYGISPYRFSAIYGNDIPMEVIKEIGLQFRQGMDGNQWVIQFLHDDVEYDFLRKECLGKIYFSRWMSRGALGCALSHLSILQDAYDSGYQTIWVIEDDICVKKDPHLLSSLIDKLDSIAPDWDVLYTDMDEHGEKKLPPNLWWMWRPDLSPDLSFIKRKNVSKEFIKIGSRNRTHSMIIRRSGMKKILDHIKENGLFLPYDHEISYANYIQLYMLTYPHITWLESTSDIQK